jgi:hypothetical protein
VLSLSQIQGASLAKGLWRCRLSLDLCDGGTLRYRWMNSAKYATDYNDAKAGLQRALGGKLSGN